MYKTLIKLKLCALKVSGKKNKIEQQADKDNFFQKISYTG
jgi:hypothetical protein